MSLTSYRAAPSRATNVTEGQNGAKLRKAERPPRLIGVYLVTDATKQTQSKWVLVKRHIIQPTPATKPGDVLLFRCLSNSTIGADWFHGRVRDGIGWVTDAMATKL
jgi:hypothetical protein